MTRRLPIPSAKVVMMIAFMAIAAVPLLASAQSAVLAPDAFTPGEKDMTRWILKAVFGDWNKDAKVPLLGSAMETLNLFALAFGTLMFTYVSVLGTFNTAQDGEFLGRKWSSMWIPLRFMGGTALLMPLSTGYSTAQHIVLWLAMMGGGGASTIWYQVMDNFGADEAVLFQRSDAFKAAVEPLARDILKAEVCVALKSRDIPGSYGTTSTTKISAVYYGKGVEWGSPTGVNESTRVCGSALTTSYNIALPTDGQYSFQVSPSNSLKTPASGIPEEYKHSGLSEQMKNLIAQVEAKKAMVDSQQNAILYVAEKLRPLAQKIASGNSDNAPTQATIANEIKAAAALYTQATQPAASKVVDLMNKHLTGFTNASKDAGWIMVGSTFFQMARIRSEIQRDSNEVPSIKPPSLADNAQFVSIDQAPLTADIGAMEDRIDESFKGDQSSMGNPGQAIALWIGQAMSVDPTSHTHALVQIKNTGDRLLMGAATAAIATTAGAGALGVAKGNGFAMLGDLATGGVSGLKAVWDFVLPAIYGGLFTLFAVGITMAFVLPMLPFTFGIGSILGWLMAVFSALTAAPVWLAGHLHPDGDEVAGKGIGGYMLLVETVTRPIFITMGFIGAFVIMDPMIKLVALLYRAAVHGVQADSFTGIISIVALAVMYVAIIWTTVRSSMSLVYVLSETVYRWIGGQHAGMEQSREFVAAAESAGQSGARGMSEVGGFVHANRQAVMQKRAHERAQKDGS